MSRAAYCKKAGGLKQHVVKETVGSGDTIQVPLLRLADLPALQEALTRLKRPDDEVTID